MFAIIPSAYELDSPQSAKLKFRKTQIFGKNSLLYSCDAHCDIHYEAVHNRLYIFLGSVLAACALKAESTECVPDTHTSSIACAAENLKSLLVSLDRKLFSNSNGSPFNNAFANLLCMYKMLAGIPFRLIVMDKHTGSILTVSDVLGTHPLYYTESAVGNFVSCFSSESIIVKPGAYVFRLDGDRFSLEASAPSPLYGSFLDFRHTHVAFDHVGFLECLTDRVRRWIGYCMSISPEIHLMLSGGVDSGLLYQVILNTILSQNSTFANLQLVCHTVSFAAPNFTGNKGENLDAEFFSLLERECPPSLIASKRVRFVMHTIVRDDYLSAVPRIKQLIKPFEPTIMNINLSSVWYHISKRIRDAAPSRMLVLLSGIGPDEMCGAYTKMRSRPPNERLEMIEHAQKNLYLRNLYRDFQVINSFGIAMLYPYLDDHVAGFLETLRVQDLSILLYGSSSDADTSIDKGIVRLAALKVGLNANIAMRPKKAAQFGSNAARMLGGEGYDICEPDPRMTSDVT